MKTVIQRTRSALVRVNNKVVGQITNGFLVFLGVGKGDTEKEADWLVRKILNLRIFSDENDKMNKNIIDVQGNILVVSQFTLYANLDGNRPGFELAASPVEAEKLYNYFVQRLKENIKVETGIFGAEMQVELLNDGPTTIILESK